MMRTLWSNSRERIEKCEKRRDAGSSYPEGLEILQKETAKGTAQLPKLLIVLNMRLKITTFVNLNESWNFKTGTSG